IRTLEEQGHLKPGGQPLDPAGKVVRGRQRTVTDGPFMEAKDLVNGFLFVEARDLAQATALASGCPMLEGDGSVEVRPGRKLDLETGAAWPGASRSSGASRGAWSRRSPGSSGCTTWLWRRTSCRTPSAAPSSPGRSAACPRTRPPGS